MFRTFSLALVAAAMTTDSAFAQFGGDAVKKPGNNQIIANGLEILGAKGAKRPTGNAKGSSLLDGSVKGIAGGGPALTKGTPVGPTNNQKGIIAILTGLAKSQGGSVAPQAAKSSVPGPVPLKEQMKGRMRSRFKNGKN